MCYRNSDTVTAYKPDRTAKHRTHRRPTGEGTPASHRVPDAARARAGACQALGRRWAPGQGGQSGHGSVLGQSTRSRLLRVFSQVHHTSLSLNVILWQKERDPLVRRRPGTLQEGRHLCSGSEVACSPRDRHTCPSDRTRAEGRPSHSRAGERGRRSLGAWVTLQCGGRGRGAAALLVAGASGEAKDRGLDSSVWDVAGQKASLLASKPRACYSLPQHPFRRPPDSPQHRGPQACLPGQ